MKIWIVDAFTDQPCTGNPAAVCVLPEGPWPQESWLRAVATEMDLSETAFVKPAPVDSQSDWDLRWFTPVTEAERPSEAPAHWPRGWCGLTGVCPHVCGADTSRPAA
ncbi:PhzF family phenazine biosynthesis protein [Kitasatospora sp. NBC_01250]|uniref:PhzF family phenazine biosynthesis protein n=1 Tax=Kitasatospora sp. NBC_01250 TaxID=2903571 RepID=UPI002E3165A8|nr:PhzF family phenazine biosynthesis protein [Kitasatospora sp. NBC_01250]